jgi:F0F1-type ATP synthase assembly protein I
MKDGRLRLPSLVVASQLMTSLVVAAGLMMIDATQAWAALLAGAVCVIPAGYFAWRAQNERAPGRLLGQGLMKLVLTLTLMALAFAWLQPAPLGFFTAFVLMQTMYVVAPALFGRAAA